MTIKMNWNRRLLIATRLPAKVGPIRNYGIVRSSENCHRPASDLRESPRCSPRRLIFTRSMPTILSSGVRNRHRRYLTSNNTHSTNDVEKNKQPLLSKTDFRYCVDLVQNRDRESYLCGLLMPSTARKAFFAIRAWNVELASIKDGSTQKKQGSGADGDGPNVALQVRMQWWWDALDRIYDDTQSQALDRVVHQSDYAPFSVSDTLAASYFKNPIVRVLNHAVHEKQLTKRFLERLSEAREIDLLSNQPETTNDMIVHADNIFSSLLYLALETVEVRDESVDVVAQHAGIGIGLVTALRGIRFRLIREECPIPKELLPVDFPYDKLIYTNHSNLAGDEEEVGNATERAIEEENLLSYEEHQSLKHAVEQVCILAHSHLSQAQQLQRNVPKHARTCFLPVIPAMHYLSKLEKVEYDIFDDKLLEHDNMTILALLGRTWLTGVF